MGTPPPLPFTLTLTMDEYMITFYTGYNKTTYEKIRVQVISVLDSPVALPHFELLVESCRGVLG